MRRWIWLLVGLGFVSAVFADSDNEWKDYDNPLLGIHMKVKRSWTEISMKETAETGSVAFNITSLDPHARVYVMRQKIDYPFDVWMSSEVLLQIYQPGYTQSGPVEFAGRKSIKVTGTPKDKAGRREETYYSSRPPFVDQITFSAQDYQWKIAEPDFAALRKSIRWTR